MTGNTQTFEDAFNLLCGDKINSGVHRDVFECRLRPDLVVKVEIAEHFRSFANVKEQSTWDYYEHTALAKWLAPCHFLSPDGRILLQTKVAPIRANELPEKLPSFLTDTKSENYGILDGQVVCVDYANIIQTASARLKKIDWW